MEQGKGVGRVFRKGLSAGGKEGLGTLSNWIGLHEKAAFEQRLEG